MKITIRDIAKQANVSIATVSRVLNNKDKGVSIETKERVLKIAKEEGYIPNAIARGLVTKQSKVIGVILPNITNPFFIEIEKGIEDTAAALGYSIILCNTDYSMQKEKKYIELLLERQVDAILYANGTTESRTEFLKIVENANTPFLIFDNYIRANNMPTVYINNEKAMYELVKYVISKGHRKIAYFRYQFNNIFSDDRFKGYIRALKDENIEINLNIIKGKDGSKDKTTVDYLDDFLKVKDQFSIIICENDLLAIDTLVYLKTKGIKVPEDVSLTGFDNIIITEYTTPRITTVNQPKYDFGRVATEYIIDILNGYSRPVLNEEFTSEIIVKESVRDLNVQIL